MATMTDKNGAAPRKGRVGEATYYQRNGKTIMRVSTNRKGNPSKSMQQARSRMVWNNVQNLWSAFPQEWHPRYQNRSAGRTHYNVFMSLNLNCQPVYFTKTECNLKPSVLIPLLISQGSLPEILVEHDGEGLRSNISVGDLVLTPETTLSQFCNAIVRNNQGINRGDVITFVHARQRSVEELGFPQVHFAICQLELDCGSNTPLDQIPRLTEGFSVRDGLIACPLNVQGAAWVLSRQVGEEQQYSTQRLWCDNAAMIAHYSSQEALENAVKSYGGIKK